MSIEPPGHAVVLLSSFLKLFAYSLAYSLAAILLWLVLSRLVFHPLAKYPGPKLAGLTSLYEDLYEVYGDANYDYIWRIKELHDRYGPIVRINPHEIHINDPQWYSTLNSFKGRWDKDPHTAHQFANPHSSVGTVDHDVHKHRKAAIQPFFAKQKIYELEPVVLGNALSLCDRLAEYGQKGMVVPMRQALKCYCVDTISEYCFAKNGDMINRPDFASEHWRQFAKGLDAGARYRYMPKWLLPAVKGAPLWIQASIGPGIQFFELWHKDVEASVDHVEERAGNIEGSVSSHRTIFEELLRSPELPKEDKQRPRLIQEGAALIGAGGETTSQVLAIIVWGLLDDDTKRTTLQKELKNLGGHTKSHDNLSLRKLESLPYLTACIKEGLRLRTGKIGRQQRVPVGRSIFYKDIEIKPGTICSMTPAFSHLDPVIFPDPHRFHPERWLQTSEEQRRQMEAYMVPYSKGTRMCSGASLASAMLYICTASLFVRLRMRLYESTGKDLEMAVDLSKHYPLRDSHGLRIEVPTSSVDIS